MIWGKVAGIFPGGEIMGEGSRDLVETAAFFTDGKAHTLNLSAGGAQGQGDLFDGAAVLEHLEQDLLFGGQTMADLLGPDALVQVIEAAGGGRDGVIEGVGKGGHGG